MGETAKGPAVSIIMQHPRRASQARRCLLLLVAALAFAFLDARLAIARAVEPLVDVAWVKAHGGEPQVRLLDVRNRIGGASAEVFAAGHIPGSVYSDYLKDGWRSMRAGVPGQLPAIPVLEALIGRLGIGNENHVVIVAAGASALEIASATRVYWTFKVLGHDAVSILDGGFRAYAADPANPIATGPSLPQPAVFTAKFRPELIADRTDVAVAMKAGRPLVDNRPSSQYLGQSRHPAATRAGTIPGARSVPESRFVDSGGRFFSRQRLAAMLRSAGAAVLDSGAITFCNTGHWASLGWFVQSELLGQPNVRLYDGSMVDWTSDSALPVAVKEKATP